jgi:hypothetical protein
LPKFQKQTRRHGRGRGKASSVTKHECRSFHSPHPSARPDPRPTPLCLPHHRNVSLPRTSCRSQTRRHVPCRPVQHLSPAAPAAVTLHQKLRLEMKHETSKDPLDRPVTPPACTSHVPPPSAHKYTHTHTHHAASSSFSVVNEGPYTSCNTC